MPELTKWFLNDPVYGPASYIPPFLFLGDIDDLRFTIYCSSNCDFGIEWAVDRNYEIIATDTFQALGGVEQQIEVPITARYGRIFVNTIATTPSNLKVQIFF